jgi:hypothetical protein
MGLQAAISSTHHAMRAKTVVTAITGVGITLLSLLWFLQGADVVHVRPILCLADCEPLVGGSVGWLIAGIIGMMTGAFLIRLSVDRARRM